MNAVAVHDQRGGRFVTGGNPGPGRPKGSRNALSERFVADVYADWCKHGAAVLRGLRQDDPAVYAKIVALMCTKIEAPRDVPAGVTVVNVITGVRG